MRITDPIEISYVLMAFAALGAILIGSLLQTCHVHRGTALVGGLTGALLGLLLIESLPWWVP